MPLESHARPSNHGPEIGWPTVNFAATDRDEDGAADAVLFAAVDLG